MGLAQHVQKGHLTDRRRDPSVTGCRRQGVAAAHRGAEGGHSLGVHAGKRPGELDRRPPVLQLQGGMEEVELALALAEAAMIEDEGEHPSRGKPLRKGSEPVPARS